MKFFLLRAFLLLLVLGFGFTSLSVYNYRQPGNFAETTVIIPPGSGVRGALAQLRAQKLIPPVWLVALPLVASNQHKLFKAGEYLITVNQSPAQIFRMIAQGRVVVHKLTIPEGWNVMQLRAAFSAEPLLNGVLPDVIAEGSVFPNTVQFTRGEDRTKVLQRMQAERETRLAKAWENRDPDLPVSTPQQALILASIVEKETGLITERAVIAGVFINRLRLGMKLQTDPSVVYGLEQKLGHPLGRALSMADLTSDTPYNSYTREGLPPSPICNPGQAAIEAVLHPASTEALFFVATGHGGHIFATTLKEHELNVAAYRRAMARK